MAKILPIRDGRRDLIIRFNDEEKSSNGISMVTIHAHSAFFDLDGETGRTINEMFDFFIQGTDDAVAVIRQRWDKERGVSYACESGQEMEIAMTDPTARSGISKNSAISEVGVLIAGSYIPAELKPQIMDFIDAQHERVRKQLEGKGTGGGYSIG